MTEPRVVELIGKRITITDTMRADVVAELPEIEWISDSTLRNNPKGAFETPGFPGLFVQAKGPPTVTNSTIQ